jgi:hypothetical protein
MGVLPVPCPPPPQTTSTSLDELADQINEAAQRAIAALDRGLEHARACGQLLIRAKSLVEHSKGEAWIKTRAEIAPRTASAWMRPRHPKAQRRSMDRP